ncbi:hypothetical protein KCE64_005006 [Salmonella enterica subsp. enterica serovar Hvittingfoss]|nr:hypothetical protein [Salmonella enterica subsp. enterica serovar Hvittingfoss]EHL2852482.1 hypothetical protein [Salmonella enterica subsp. enterica serovar Hvittingfoss]
MPDSEITDMIAYYSRLMTGRVLNPIYLNYSPDDFNSELRLLILSVNDGLNKGRMISAMLDKTEYIIADKTINYLEKQKNKLKGLCNYLKQCRGTQHKKEIKSTTLILIDEAVHICDEGNEQMEKLIHQARKTRCLLWLHP